MQKHKVVAFVREPKKVTLKNKNLTVVAGNVRDLDALKKATKGANAVISALGTSDLKRTTLHSNFARNIVSAMEANNFSRIITVSAWGVGDSKTQTKLPMRLLSTIFLRHVFADIERAERILIKSDLDYTFIRPGRLVDAPARKTVKVSTNKKPHVSISISRKDVAGFAVDQVDSESYFKQAPIIGY